MALQSVDCPEGLVQGPYTATVSKEARIHTLSDVSVVAIGVHSDQSAEFSHRV